MKIPNAINNKILKIKNQSFSTAKSLGLNAKLITTIKNPERYYLKIEGDKMLNSSLDIEQVKLWYREFIIEAYAKKYGISDAIMEFGSEAVPLLNEPSPKARDSVDKMKIIDTGHLKRSIYSGAI
jgi:hypothetical protein